MIDGPWLIGVERHKLADPWRRQARDRRRLVAAGDAAVTGPPALDPWPTTLDRMSAETTLRSLAPQYRHVLSLRYLDDLPVAECADLPAGLMTPPDPSRPLGATVSRTGGTRVTTAPDPISAAIPYLAIGGLRAREAISWYGQIFGATVNGEPYVEGERIGHADLQIGAGVIYIADEAPELGVVGPGGGADVSLMLPVADADATLAAALAAGATTNREPYDGYGRRNAWLVDPFGHRWGLNSPIHVR